MVSVSEGGGGGKRTGSCRGGWEEGLNGNGEETSSLERRERREGERQEQGEGREEHEGEETDGLREGGGREKGPRGVRLIQEVKGHSEICSRTRREWWMRERSVTSSSDEERRSEKNEVRPFSFLQRLFFSRLPPRLRRPFIRLLSPVVEAREGKRGEEDAPRRKRNGRQKRPSQLRRRRPEGEN